MHHILARQARQAPGASALWWQGEPVSYGELGRRVDYTATKLAAWAPPGQRVAVLSWNCPRFIELIYALAAAGHILVPLNARLAPEELAYQLHKAEVSLLLGEEALLEPLVRHPDFPVGPTTLPLGEECDAWLQQWATAALPTIAATDPAWILFTSGTTGRPKGALLSHGSLLAGLDSAAIGRPVQPGDRFLYPFPLFHVAAHNVLLQHLYGAAVVLLPSFDAGQVLAACRELNVSTLSLAPTMVAMLLEHPNFRASDLAGVRAIGYGAAAMPSNLLQQLLRETDLDLSQGYGMTELSGSVSFLTPEDHRLAAADRPELLASVGRPLPTAEVIVADETGQACPTGEAGEILVRGPQCMLGYWQDPQANDRTLVQGWLHTGDIGRFDQQGYLYIVDRKKDMVVSGGENVASREVEEILRRHGAVRDCAVIGLPHPRWGEAVCAVVQLLEEVSDDELSAHCRRHLAAYKTPKTWVRRDSLPLNAAGKVDKGKLRTSLEKKS